MNGRLCEAPIDWIDIERPIKWTLMCKEDEALFGWIDVERPIKWMLMCEKDAYATYFVSNRYSSLNVMMCRFVSCHIFRIYLRQMSFYLFNYIS